MEIKRFESFDLKKDFKQDGSEGWINVKIDKFIYVRMMRYIPSLDNIILLNNDVSSKYDLYKKVQILSNVENWVNNENITVQDKISIITILQYLKEIVNNFSASSAGFLMEGFLATLISAKIVEGHGKVDILGPKFETESHLTYQIKLYQKGSSIKIHMSEEMCDYYVICVKDGNLITINILSGSPTNLDFYIDQERFTRSRKIKSPEEEIIHLENLPIHHRSDNPDFSKPYIIIDTSKLCNALSGSNIVLNISTANINGLIAKCGKTIIDYLKTVYNQLSDLHYNIDTLVTGIDKQLKVVSPDVAYDEIGKNIITITDEVKKLKKGIIRKRPNSRNII